MDLCRFSSSWTPAAVSCNGTCTIQVYRVFPQIRGLLERRRLLLRVVPSSAASPPAPCSADGSPCHLPVLRRRLQAAPRPAPRAFSSARSSAPSRPPGVRPISAARSSTPSRPPGARPHLGRKELDPILWILLDFRRGRRAGARVRGDENLHERLHDQQVGDLNHLISATMSGVTCCLRFPGQLNSDLR
ncbi:unnamed protein product [Urochloa humidicola]